MNAEITDREALGELEAFVFQKWVERAESLGRSIPKDLEGACKFASLFVQQILGGEIQGNREHQFNVLPTGEIVDITASSLPLTHDSDFFGNPEHQESLDSCMPRVEAWVEDYLEN